MTPDVVPSPFRFPVIPAAGEANWKLGDMVICENTRTMHRALAYDLNSGRLMHRTKLEGEEAFA